MRALLANVKFAAFTTDMWSNTKRESFLGLTIHFIDKNYKLVNLVLATKEVNEEHSGDNLVAWLEAILEEYEVSPHQIVGVVTDNGANIVNACGKLHQKYEWIHIRCAAHTLQLCLKEGFAIPQIQSAIGKQ